MNEYELKLFDELTIWKQRLTKRSGIIAKFIQRAQGKLNNWLPVKIHSLITKSIQEMIKTTLAGAEMTTNKNQAAGLTLKERDTLARKKISIYQKTALVEGAGTGAGGFLLGLADFPLLLSIKIKFLFEIAAVYGFDTRLYQERIFILHVFRLAFSSKNTRKNVLALIENWEEYKNQADINWDELQQEYRDYLDLVKLLQFIPGIGAIAGAAANQFLLAHLGETAMNAYRLRILTTPPVFL